MCEDDLDGGVPVSPGLHHGDRLAEQRGQLPLPRHQHQVSRHLGIVCRYALDICRYTKYCRYYLDIYRYCIDTVSAGRHTAPPTSTAVTTNTGLMVS